MVTFNVDSLDFADDEEARFGAGADFSARYSSSNSRLELEDLTAGTVGYIPQDISTDLVGGKFAETVSEGKALADDGNVYDSIQEAENNASSWVKVGPGTFNESVTIDTAGLTLEGSGNRTIVFGSITVNEPNCLIKNIHIDNVVGDGVRFNAGSTAENLLITNTSGSGINFTTTGCVARNCTIRDVGGQGVGANNNCTVTNCDIKVVGNTGIVAFSNTIVSGNNIEDVNSHGVSLNSDTIVIANTLKDCDITIGGADSIVANNRIDGGSIDDNGTGTVLDVNLTT